MRSLLRLDAALRYWQSQYDSLAMDVERLVIRHRSIERARTELKQQTTEHHLKAVGSDTFGDSLLALHSNLTAHGRFDQRSAVQQRALAEQIAEKRKEMLALKRKLKQVEALKAGAQHAAALAADRKVEQEAAYLFLIRNGALE